ncbi:asparagine synthetase B family protein [Amycolatopsis aidingensis]|uniref:asparagine synthetase B family protein n=1 Tax=Amycolatopsis aidingensis TaxID=2842453 RepID=UPI001C0DD1F3|nr:asparagine synthase-related protein [Amycolatopsis aidingensis]
MSGIAGWIDFSRDLTLNRPIVRTLTATLAPRGPDEEAVWTSAPAALGYRGLRTEQAQGRQPFVLEVGGRQVAACLAGAPTGLPELRQRLHSFDSAIGADTPQAELATKAYLRWGTDFIPALSGAFALAVWDERAMELVLARGPMGGQPLYYTETGTGLVFGSERKTLLAHPEVRPVVDLEGLREVVAHALPPGPLFSGFGEVEPAQIARFGRAGWDRRRYWTLRTEPHTDDLPTTIATIRSMLEESTRKTLPADPGALTVMLSGGIDSSSVAALTAAQLRRTGGGAPRTCTIDYQDSEFRPDVMRSSEDAPFARMVAEHIGAEHSVVPLAATDTLSPTVRLGIMRALDGPTRIYDMDSAQHLFLQHVAAQGNKVILTGFGGDNAFLGANWSNDRELVDSGTFPWVALAQRHGAMNGFGTGLLSKELLGKLDLPAYYRDAYAEITGRVEHLPGADEWQRKMRTVSYLVLTLFRSDYAMFAAAGLQARSPISDPELLQYAYNIPAEMQAHRGIEKGLLRAAVADLLPPEVVDRPRSATPVSHDPGYPRRLHEEFVRVLADQEAPVRPLIDTEAADQIAREPAVAAGNRMTRADMELVLQLNLWLEEYRVRLAL